MAHSMWDLVPSLRIKPGPLHWERRVLATDHQGIPSFLLFKKSNLNARRLSLLSLGAIDIWGRVILLFCGASLCAAGCLAASLVSTHWVPIAAPPMS